MPLKKEKTAICTLHKQKLQELQSALNYEALSELKAHKEAILHELGIVKKKTQEVYDNIRELQTDIVNLDTELALCNDKEIDYFLYSGEMLFKCMEKSNERGSRLKNIELKKFPAKATAMTFTKKPELDYYTIYRRGIEPDYIIDQETLVTDENYCFQCSEFRVLNSNESKMVCEKCASETDIVNTSEKPSISEPPADVRYYEYKRFHHYCDWLDNLQGKENSRVPGPVIDAVKKEIMRVKMENRLDELNVDDIKDFLHKYSRLKYDKYYEHATQILFRITAIQPLQMTPEMETNLKQLFLMIQEPFEYFKKTRLNFPSYSYIIYKFCQLLGYDEWLSKLKLLADEKLYESDLIWRDICECMGGEETGWKFIKSYSY